MSATSPRQEARDTPHHTRCHPTGQAHKWAGQPWRHRRHWCQSLLGADDSFQGADSSCLGMGGPFRGAAGSFLGADDPFLGADGSFQGADDSLQGADGPPLCSYRRSKREEYDVTCLISIGYVARGWIGGAGQRRSQDKLILGTRSSVSGTYRRQEDSA